MRIKSVIITLVASACASCGSPLAPTLTVYPVEVTVRSAQGPLFGAVVDNDGPANDRLTTTDTNGRALVQLPSGPHCISAWKQGYNRAEVCKTVTGADAWGITLQSDGN